MDTFFDTVSPSSRHVLADRKEVEVFRDVYARCPEDVRLTYGVDVKAWPGAASFCAPGVDTLYFNRAIVLDPERIDEAVLSGICSWYTRAGTRRYFIQVPPLTDGMHEMLLETGLEPYNRWVKLTRGGGSVPDIDARVTVERAGTGTEVTFGSILARCFEWPEAFVPWFAALVSAPGWHTYIARVGHSIVGVGAMHLTERTAYMGPAATLPEARGRGAQTALIAARLREAIALGATDFVTETSEDTTQRASPSYHNLRRFGFGVYYLRENYIGYTE